MSELTIALMHGQKIPKQNNDRRGPVIEPLNAYEAYGLNNLFYTVILPLWPSILLFHLTIPEEQFPNGQQ